VRALLVLALAAIALATLWPMPPIDPAPGGSLVRLDPAAADFARNLALFLPIGALLARRPRRVAVGAALAASAAVELLQLAIPGRVPSPWDVVANGLGAAGGHVLAGLRARAWAGDPVLARRAYGTWSAIVVVALVVASAGHRIALPPPPYFGHWTPDLGHLETYTGRLDAVELDGAPLPIGRIAGSEIRDTLGGPHVLRVRGTAGTPPARLSGLVLITDVERREVAMIGLRGERAMYRLRTLGDVLGLESGFPWWDEAFAGVDAGAPFTLSARRDGATLCLSVSGRERCGLAPRIEDGWLQWLPAPMLPATTRRTLGMAWLVVLFAPLGYGLRARPDRIAGVTAAIAALASAPWLGPVEPLAPAMGATVGLALGLGRLARVVRERAARPAQPA
jgi:VanZ family protein